MMYTLLLSPSLSLLFFFLSHFARLVAGQQSSLHSIVCALAYHRSGQQSPVILARLSNKVHYGFDNHFACDSVYVACNDCFPTEQTVSLALQRIVSNNIFASCSAEATVHLYPLLWLVGKGGQQQL